MEAVLFAVATWCWGFAIWHFIVRARDPEPPALREQERWAAEQLYGRKVR